MECEHCHKNFSCKSSLTLHKKTNLKCLAIQDENGIKINKKCHTCSHCEKEFTTKTGLDYHLGVCKNKVKTDKDLFEKEELLKTITQLKLEVDLLKSKQPQPAAHTINNSNSHNTTNNITNNNISITNYMTEEHVLGIFRKHFNRNDLPEKNLADFTYKWFLKGQDKPVYLCTDPTRKRFVFMDEQGKEVIDKNCSTLISLLYQAQPYIKDLIQDEIIDQPVDEVTKIKDQYHAFMNLEKDGNEYKLQLCRVLPPTQQAVKTVRKPAMTDINWDINQERERARKEPEEDETNPDDPFGFFYTFGHLKRRL